MDPLVTRPHDEAKQAPTIDVQKETTFFRAGTHPSGSMKKTLETIHRTVKENFVPPHDY